MNALQRLALVAALLPLPACAGLGSLEQVLGGLGGMGGSEVHGEVGNVDERRQEIEVVTDQRRTVRVRYDSRTEVVYQNRRYSVRDLERGDLVSLRVQRDSRGDPYTERIVVRENVRDRQGGGYGDYGTGQIQRFEGRVGRLDYQRGWFELRAGSGATYTVTMPYNPASADLDRFRRLRSGDAVRLDGTLLTRDRIELDRFR